MRRKLGGLDVEAWHPDLLSPIRLEGREGVNEWTRRMRLLCAHFNLNVGQPQTTNTESLDDGEDIPWRRLSFRLAEAFVPAFAGPRPRGPSPAVDWPALDVRTLQPLASLMLKKRSLSLSAAMKRWAQSPSYPFGSVKPETAEKRTRTARLRIIKLATRQSGKVMDFPEALRAVAVHRKNRSMEWVQGSQRGLERANIRLARALERHEPEDRIERLRFAVERATARLAERQTWLDNDMEICAEIPGADS